MYRRQVAVLIVLSEGLYVAKAAIITGFIGSDKRWCKVVNFLGRGKGPPVCHNCIWGIAT